MSKYENLKSVVEGVVSTSVGLVTHTVIARNTPSNLKFFPRLGMRFGTLVIGSLLSKMAAKAITDNMDEFVANISKVVEEVETPEVELPIEVVPPKPKRKPATKVPPKTDV